MKSEAGFGSHRDFELTKLGACGQERFFSGRDSRRRLLRHRGNGSRETDGKLASSHYFQSTLVQALRWLPFPSPLVGPILQ